MRKRIIKVLIGHNDDIFLRYLSVEVSRKFEVLGIYAHIIIATTFKVTKKKIEKEDIDISCIDFNWEDEVGHGHGEDLIELIKRTAPHQAIITIMDNDDTNYRLKIYDKYYPIMCLTKKMLFSNLARYLEKALLSLGPYSQIVVTDTHTKRFYLEEIAYVYGHAGKTTVFTYDFEAKRYKKAAIPLSITNFLAQYDKLGIFIKCHRDYAVNRMMIRFIRKSREYQCIELIYNDNDYPVEIPMSESGKKHVIKEMDKKVKGAVLT